MLRAAHGYAALTDWHLRRPALDLEAQSEAAG